MRKKLFLGLITILLAALILTACSSPTATPPATTTNIPPTATTASPTAAPTTATTSPVATVRPVTPTAAPAATATATPAPQGNKVGDTASESGYKMTLNAVESAKEYGIAKAKSGNTFIALDLIFESSQDGISLNPAYATVTDSAAKEYELVAGGKYPYLPALNNLAAGERIRGWWTFEVPETAKGLVFSYQASPNLRFNLEQMSSAPAKLAPLQLPKVAKIGETVTELDYAVTVNGAEKSKDYGYAKAKNGMVFVTVDVTVASNKNFGVNVNPLYANIRDSEFFSYPGFALGKEPSLKSANDLPKGQTMRGWVTLEIPETAKNLIFEYRAGTPETHIRVNLGL